MQILPDWVEAMEPEAQPLYQQSVRPEMLATVSLAISLRKLTAPKTKVKHEEGNDTLPDGGAGQTVGKSKARAGYKGSKRR